MVNLMIYIDITVSIIVIVLSYFQQFYLMIDVILVNLIVYILIMLLTEEVDYTQIMVH